VVIVLALLGVAGAWAIQPFLLAHQETRQIRALQAEVAALEAKNEVLRRRARILNTPRGIEIEARRLGWVRPGEVLIQTSNTPPPPAADAPSQLPDAPPLGAVRQEAGALRRALQSVGGALERWLGQRPAAKQPPHE
jgi:cell division protein FtsB